MTDGVLSGMPGIIRASCTSFPSCKQHISGNHTHSALAKQRIREHAPFKNLKFYRKEETQQGQAIIIKKKSSPSLWCILAEAKPWRFTGIHLPWAPEWRRQWQYYHSEHTPSLLWPNEHCSSPRQRTLLWIHIIAKAWHQASITLHAPWTVDFKKPHSTAQRAKPICLRINYFIFAGTWPFINFKKPGQFGTWLMILRAQQSVRPLGHLPWMVRVQSTVWPLCSPTNVTNGRGRGGSKCRHGNPECTILFAVG